MKETPVQERIRLEAGAQNVMIQRNNVGACYDDTGRLIRYGLMNDTAQLNKRFKSSDLIGILPTVVTQDMVGSIIGRYLAAECKASDWHMIPSDERAAAQLAYHNLVRQYGGVAGFVRSVDDFKLLIGRAP